MKTVIDGREQLEVNAHLSLIEALRLRLHARNCLRVRFGDGGDRAFVRAVLFDLWRPGFVGLPEAAVTQLLDLQFRVRQQGYARMFPCAETGIIERKGAPVGSLTVVRTGSDGLHLVDIALLASACGQGIGTDVLTALITVAREEGCRRLTLSVARTNVAAERFYARLGFKPLRDDAAPCVMNRDMAFDL